MNKKLKWPETPQPAYYTCAICAKSIAPEMNADEHRNIWYTPNSRYWSVGEVYCGAEHSFERHIQILNITKCTNANNKI